MKAQRVLLSMIFTAVFMLGTPRSQAQEAVAEDSKVHRSTQRFHVATGDQPETFVTHREHEKGRKEKDAAFTVQFDKANDNLLVFTKAYSQVPRYYIEVAENGEIHVYTTDKGTRRAEQSYVVKRDGNELSVFRFAKGRLARFRSNVVRVESAQTLVHATGSGNTPLKRVGRRVDHADFGKVTGFSYDALPMAELTGILCALDMARGS